jgi:hypothetical protein
MGSISRKRKSGKRRKHSPELLRFKRAARALNIPWSQVTAERDRLRREELDKREHADSLHKAATQYWGGSGAAPFWRGFFRRKFDKLIRSGGDYTKVRQFDEFVAQHFCPNDVLRESLNHDSITNGRSCQDAWELLIEDRPPLRSIWEVYEEAIYNIIQGKAGESATPF